jgi:hypothetical protein
MCRYVTVPFTFKRETALVSTYHTTHSFHSHTPIVHTTRTDFVPLYLCTSVPLYPSLSDMHGHRAPRDYLCRGRAARRRCGRRDQHCRRR